MSMLPVGIGSAEAGGYQIERSLRFNSADSAYLNRTPASAGNRKTWTWSGWVKRSALGTTQVLFGQGTGTLANGYMFLRFDSDNLQLSGTPDGGTFSILWTSTAVFRDPSGWYHVVATLDTTQATGSNRFKLYVNGVEQAGTFGTTPTQNADLQINRNSAHQIGVANAGSLANYLNGYLTEINFIDGQALTPSSFGETDTDTGVWKPKKYTGTYGTNGFYLNFSDNSGTTSTTLGKDSSGNGNNWTPNNFSVTAGAGNDSLVDTPTNYGTDTGVGGEVRGNYSTFNPLSAVGSTLSNGNLDVSGTSNAFHGTMAVTSGKWYFEFRKNANGDNQLGISRGYSSATVTSFRRAWRDDNGSPSFLTDNGTAGSGTAQSLTTGDILGVALDMDNNAVYFAKNNVWMNSGVPTSGASKTGAIWTDLAGYAWQVYAGGNANGCYTSLNAGQRPFAYTAPSGFKALCTQNLPEPTIVDGGEYFNTVLYTGNGSTQSITGVGFQPDFTWIKERNGAATYHAWFDAVRGVTKALYSNDTSAEVTGTAFTSFDSNGFTLSLDTNQARSNDNGDTYVAWNWKANGAGSSNTAGTITSTVSVNTTSGFSIVTYTGNNTTGATIGHGLGVAPSMIIIKDRLQGTGYNWNVYHASLGNTQRVFLDATSAATTGVWNSTSPTSTVFTLTNNVAVNGTDTYVAYCFAAIPGYSAFGSYTGNGSADGPFVYLGFRPRWVLTKPISGDLSGWTIWDSEMNTYNQMNTILQPHLSNAEQINSVFGMDFTSNGFKIRGTNGVHNSSNPYLYAAFAENPFKYSLAR